MATRNAIERLSRRIDALAYRRRGRFTLDQLTDGVLQKLRGSSRPAYWPLSPDAGGRSNGQRMS
jgi:hypothetical protein